MSNSIPFRGWILYDGECRYCRSLASRFGGIFDRRGFKFTPFPAGPRPPGMRVRKTDGGDFGGSEAVIFLVGFLWWGKPLRWFAKIPGARILLRRIYREIAVRRSCDGEACALSQA